MKKLAAVLLIFTMFCSFSSVFGQEQNIKIMNGFERLQTDVEPIIVDPGYTLIPVAALARAVGYEVRYFHEQRQVTLKKEGFDLLINLDSEIITVNGKEEKLDVAATIYKDRTVVPLRFISETMQKKVNYKNYGDQAVIWITDFDVLIDEAFNADDYLTQDKHIFYLKGDRKTTRGIQLGVSPEMVIEKYGIPVSDKSLDNIRVITYVGEYIMGEIEPQTIAFYIENGIVTNVCVIKP